MLVVFSELFLCLNDNLFNIAYFYAIQFGLVNFCINYLVLVFYSELFVQLSEASGLFLPEAKAVTNDPYW